MNKAIELMCETELPISDIIAAVGYENGSYFHRGLPGKVSCDTKSLPGNKQKAGDCAFVELYK